MPSSTASRLSAARIAVGYAVVAILWIALSDLVVTHFRLHPALLTIKGIAFVGVTACLLHLTIRRLVETVQRTSRERDETASLYRTVVEASEQGICLLDDSGRISFLNSRLGAMLRLPVEELQGKQVTGFIDEPELLIHTCNSRKESRTHECRLRTGSANKPWVLISSTPLYGDEGVFCGCLAMFLDITERKYLEEELRQSQKLQALGAFAGGITHDFNNLLSIMTGYGSLLEKTLPAGTHEGNAAREIIHACERGSLLIRQLLAFCRKQPAVAELVQVGESVTRFGDVLPRIVGEHIAVTVLCEDSAGSVRIGGGQIEQILMNLAANARDAMPDGGALTITTRAAEVGVTAALAQGVKPETYVAIQVSDTGIGIAPDLKAHIFEPFFTTKPQDSGTGLGLSIVYGIVAQNGGFITCDSTVGVGTTFTVYLPLARASSVQEEQAENEPCSISGTETVLLVEDEPALRALTKHILSSHGYLVLEAANAMEALRLIENGQNHLDVLLTDVVMPGMGGVELADRVSHARPGTRIVFMSGHAELSDRLEPKADVIQKPVLPDALLLQLRTILNSRSGEAHHAA